MIKLCRLSVSRNVDGCRLGLTNCRLLASLDQGFDAENASVERQSLTRERVIQIQRCDPQILRERGRRYANAGGDHDRLRWDRLPTDRFFDILFAYLCLGVPGLCVGDQNIGDR